MTISRTAPRAVGQRSPGLTPTTPALAIRSGASTAARWTLRGRGARGGVS
jgi:hypothetical protein